MSGMTLPEFLLARLAEDEAAAHHARGLLGMDLPWHAVDDLRGRGLTAADAHHIARHNPARVLAECEAKRQRIAHYERISKRSDGGMLEREEYILAAGAVFVQLKYDAAVYVDHPDYREEWKP